MRFYEFVLLHTLFPRCTRSCLDAHAPKAAHALNLAAHALCITSLHTLLDESRQNFVSIFSTVFFFYRFCQLFLVNFWLANFSPVFCFIKILSLGV